MYHDTFFFILSVEFPWWYSIFQFWNSNLFFQFVLPPFGPSSSVKMFNPWAFINSTL